MRLFGTACAVTFAALAVLAMSSTASAGPVVWTIDSNATNLVASGVGQATGSGSSTKLRIVSQVASSAAGTNTALPVKMSGRLFTDTDFTSQITFLKSGAVEGEATGVYKPDQTGADNALPGDVGATMQARVGLSYMNAGDVTLRDLQYDLTGSVAKQIVAGSFSTSGMAVSVVDGDLDYRGYGLGAIVGQGTVPVTPEIAGDANFDGKVDGADYTVWADNFFKPNNSLIYQGDFNQSGKIDGADYTVWADNFLKSFDPYLSAPNTAGNGSIAVVGSVYQLTLPIQTTLRVQLFNDNEANYMDVTYSGYVIATAPIPTASVSAVPEPSTALLTGIGAVGLLLLPRFRAPRAKPRPGT